MNILCAVDFSPSSEVAVRLAASLARRGKGSLVLMHAIESPPLSFPDIPIGPSTWERDMSIAAETDLARQATELRGAGVSVETRVLLGSPSRLIIEVARELQAELIVLGSHGRKGAARFFLGSVAEYVARTASCPVLAARSGPVEAGRWDGSAALRLTVAADGSRASQAAFAWAGKMAKAGPCELALERLYWPAEEAVRYGLPDPWGDEERHPDLLPLLERDLERDASVLLGAPSVRLRFRAAGRDAAEVLARDAADHPADALVIGVPRHRTASWTALSAAAVLRAATVPVFCVPEAAAARRRLTPARAILIACDLSDTSKEVMLPAYGLLAGSGGHVELCYVHARGPAASTSETPAVPPLGGDERAVIEQRLRSLIPAEAVQLGISTSVSVLEGRLADEAILQAAERLDVDVVALGSHGRSGVRRALMGSVAEQVSRRSPRPVLIVRPGAR